MSYDKYIKYKTKYLDLKAHIHNEKLHNETFQFGGKNNNNEDEDILNTLGTTPNSDIFNNNINKLVGGTHDLSIDESESELKSELKSESDSDNLHEELSSTNKIIETTQTKKHTQLDGKRKIKKSSNVFSGSDSDINDETSSSLLSFSSMDSESSSI